MQNEHRADQRGKPALGRHRRPPAEGAAPPATKQASQASNASWYQAGTTDHESNGQQTEPPSKDMELATGEHHRLPAAKVANPGAMQATQCGSQARTAAHHLQKAAILNTKEAWQAGTRHGPLTTSRNGSWHQAATTAHQPRGP